MENGLATSCSYIRVWGKWDTKALHQDSEMGESKDFYFDLFIYFIFIFFGGVGGVGGGGWGSSARLQKMRQKYINFQSINYHRPFVTTASMHKQGWGKAMEMSREFTILERLPVACTMRWGNR